jgi:hypothetical protein
MLLRKVGENCWKLRGYGSTFGLERGHEPVSSNTFVELHLKARDVLLLALLACGKLKWSPCHSLLWQGSLKNSKAKVGFGEISNGLECDRSLL